MAVHVLWDESHIWGLLVVRALAAWGVERRLVRGAEVAGGALAGASMVVVPGGNARLKAGLLGSGGMAALRGFVEAGGSYVGVCGGAGLGLAGGLALCPWRRRPFEDRLKHLVSGHVHVKPEADDGLVPEGLSAAPLVPVWWPARFEPECAEGSEGVRVLGRYGEPGPDMWVADLPLAGLSAQTFADWQAMYGLELYPDFLAGEPCLVHGTLGKGRYLLSYAHLETPASSQANRWLAHLLGELGGEQVDPARVVLPEWEPQTLAVRWDDAILLRARRTVAELVELGKEHLLMFPRTPWLHGWRRGIPGLALNSLLTLAYEVCAREPGDAAVAFWRERREAFGRALGLFSEGVRGFLLAERLEMTLSHGAGGFCLPHLREQREVLFGQPPGPGGLHARLQADLEELIRLLENQG